MVIIIIILVKLHILRKMGITGLVLGLSGFVFVLCGVIMRLETRLLQYPTYADFMINNPKRLAGDILLHSSFLIQLNLRFKKTVHPSKTLNKVRNEGNQHFIFEYVTKLRKKTIYKTTPRLYL